MNPCSRFSPRLEALEGREVPAVHIFMTGHILEVVGDGHANAITIHDNGKGAITVDAGGQSFTATGIDHIKIATHGGSDHVNYDLTGPLKVTEDIQVWLGRGADTAHFNFSDGVAAGGHLKLTADGGPGKDHLTATIGSVAKGGSAVVDLNGGKGNDTLALHASGKVAGRLSATVTGGAGHNTDTVAVHDKVTETGHLVVTLN